MSDIDGPQYVRREMTGEPLIPVTNAAVVNPARVVAQQPVVVAPAAQVRTVAAPAGAVQTAYSRRFAPDAVIAALVGLALLIVGLLAITRGGFDGTMEEPVVEVLGFTHTTTLGLIEIAVGVCLLLCGATSSRSGAIFFGAVLGIGAFVGAVQTDSFVEPLALESSMAWLLVVAAVVVVATALLLPRYITRSTSVRPMT